MTGKENKVVPMNPAPAGASTEPPRGERAMSRDERRLIIEKMREVYLNETVGYKEDWSDHKVAEDMGCHESGWPKSAMRSLDQTISTSERAGCTPKPKA